MFRVDLDRRDPTRVLREFEEPVLDLGKLGCFDDCGVMPSSLVASGDRIYLYYLGYNTRRTVLHSNALGLAVSEDGGDTFSRMYEGPIVDRTPEEPYFALTCDVLREDDGWQMWYTSGTGWEVIRGRPEQQYHIKHARSEDGIRWIQKNHSCILPQAPLEAIGRPTVLFDDDRYQMWYVYRQSHDYRDGAGSYRIGYAESADGLDWERMDERVGLDKSEAGWDSTMLSYAYADRLDGRRILLYNGNGFGETGFGLATWE